MLQMIDFSSSCVITSSVNYKTQTDAEGVHNNTCRTHVLAACELINDRTGESDVFYLGKACIGEHMYKGDQIAQIPTSEVCLIFSRKVCKVIKKFAQHKDDVIQIKEPGRKQRQFDGTFYDYGEISFHISTVPARRLENMEQVITSTLNLEPMVGRTTLANPATGWRAVLEYPIIYMNVHPASKSFGIDIGPVIYPDLQADAQPSIRCLELAYIMYQRFDRAEFAVRVPTDVSESGSARTLHYSRIVHLDADNALFGFEKK